MVSVSTPVGGVVTLRLNEWASAAELSQAMKSQLDKIAGGPVVVIVDLSTVRVLRQPIKAALYRMLENNRVLKVGFCGPQETIAELSDLLPLLARVRPVAVEGTEAGVRQKLGISQPEPEQKLGGMLSHLRAKNGIKRLDLP